MLIKMSKEQFDQEYAECNDAAIIPSDHSSSIIWLYSSSDAYTRFADNPAVAFRQTHRINIFGEALPVLILDSSIICLS